MPSVSSSFAMAGRAIAIGWLVMKGRRASARFARVALLPFIIVVPITIATALRNPITAITRFALTVMKANAYPIPVTFSE